MKRSLKIGTCAFIFLFAALTGFAQDRVYKVEVLQVAAVAPFQLTYDSFVEELANNGLVQGKNLVINRAIIDFDLEKAGLWKKIGVLMRIKSEASRIADAKPDLAVTIGTPATKYAKDAIISAGVPLVFTNVAIPETAGCKSLTEAGPGFTGTTLYMNIRDALRIVKLAFPSVTTIGIVHSDDDNAIAHTELTKKEGPAVGYTVLAKEVAKNDSIKPTVYELIDKGAQAFIVPLDTYYGMRDNEPAREIAAISLEKKIPIISFMHFKCPGAALYIGSEFTTMGVMAAQQSVKILKEGVSPDSLPILRQEDLTIMVDTSVLDPLDIKLPMEILQLSKAVE